MGGVGDHQITGTEIQGAFRLEDIAAVGTAQVRRSMSVVVITSAVCWDYAAAMPLRRAELGDEDAAADPVIVRLDVHVNEGRVGFGALAEDGTTFLVERLVDAGMEPQRVDLLFGPLSRCRNIVIRNASQYGVSRAVIDSIQTLAAAVPTLPATPAVLEPPSGMATGPMANWERYYGHSFPEIETQIRQHQLGQMEGPRGMRWLWGLQVIVDPRTEMGRAIYLSGRYEPTTMHVMERLLPEGACFMDIGANAGIFTLAGAAAVGSTGHVIAFEPSSREYAILRNNIEINRLDHVRALQQAVADTTGRAELRVAEALHSGHNTLGSGFAYSDVGTQTMESVEVTTVDFAAAGLARLDLVKIDVEGAEFRVLRGARETLARLRPMIILELFDKSLQACGASAAEVRACLEQTGYSLWRPDDATGRLGPDSPDVASQSANVVAIPAERAAQVVERVNA